MQTRAAPVKVMSAKPQSLPWGRCYLGCHTPLTADGWGASRARLLKLGTCAAAQDVAPWWLAWRRGEGFEEEEREDDTSKETAHSYTIMVCHPIFLFRVVASKTRPEMLVQAED